MKLKSLIAVIALFATQMIFAQAASDSELYVALKKADSVLFEECFNKCNVAALEKIIHPDLLFLHDKGGIRHRTEFFKAIKENICSGQNAKPIRKLVPGSLVVYPLENNGQLYGAIQMGIHEFYISEPGKALRHTSTAKFTHTWLLENGEWKLYNVLSYDHQEPKKI
ncbi:MAG TPA: nuclear transport factor 2 family protein [Flavobacterium sp.]|nr:nuclear transport factor 2 family protein [Flavobacterium sp.]